MVNVDYNLVDHVKRGGLSIDLFKVKEGTGRNFLLGLNPESLIGIGRLVTALFAVLAIYLDPTQPASSLIKSHMILGIYVTFALLLVIFQPCKSFDSPVHLLIHIVDAAVLGWLAFLTNELTSPFFSFLPFVLLAMTLRWGLRGAVLGAVVLQVVLVTVGLPDLEDGDSELNVFIMRSTYFMVAAVMLGYFGAYREHHRQRLTQLAHWPFDAITGDRTSWVRGLFRHAAEVLGDPSLLVVWRDQDEDIGSVAFWSRGHLQLIEVRDLDFWNRHDLEPPSPNPGRDGTPTANDEEVARILRELPQLATKMSPPFKFVCSSAFSSERYRGRVFVINPACHPDECGSLTDIIAMRFRSELGRLALMQQTMEAARSEERVRLARDLHDSVLQDLTAASLKLKLIANSVPNRNKNNVVDVNDIVFNLQQRIRQYVDDQRCVDQYAGAPSIHQTLRDLISLLSQQWGCQIEITVDPPEFEIPKPMLHEIMQLVSEATANAARHGKATQLRIQLTRVEGGVELNISDNGSGIDVKIEPKRPLSLSARVRDLKGRLTIGSASPGLSLRIELPFGWVVA